MSTRHQGVRLPPVIIERVRHVLATTSLTMSQIGVRFDLSSSGVREINRRLGVRDYTAGPTGSRSRWMVNGVWKGTED